MCEKYFDKIKYFLKFETLNAYFRYFLIFTAKKNNIKTTFDLIYNSILAHKNDLL